MYNNHQSNKKQDENKPKSLKRYNVILERDENSDFGYIYMGNFSHKNPPKVSKSESIETANGIFVFDYSGDKICGIEILNFSEKVHVYPNMNNVKSLIINDASDTTKEILREAINIHKETCQYQVNRLNNSGN
jgi:uncharacterized protein YuzE